MEKRDAECGRGDWESKREVILVESEEIQDYVREGKGTEQEEKEKKDLRTERGERSAKAPVPL